MPVLVALTMLDTGCQRPGRHGHGSVLRPGDVRGPVSDPVDADELPGGDLLASVSVSGDTATLSLTGRA